MSIRDLTDGQVKQLQGVCMETYRAATQSREIPAEVWNKAFTRGVEATMTMFAKQIRDHGEDTKRES